MNASPYDAYLRSTHRLGRIVSVITLVLLVGAPFVIGSMLGAMPDLSAVGRGFLSVGLCGPCPAWWSFWFTRPCSARAAAIWPSSPAT